MEIEYKHSLTEADARARLERLGKYLGARHGIAVTWDNGKARFNGKYMVVKIDGELTIGASMVSFRGADPGFLWRKKASDYIQNKLENYLDPKTALNDLPVGA